MKIALDIQKVWSKIRKELEAGESIKTLSEKYKLSVSRISAEQKKWEKEAYFKDSRFAKYHTPEYKSWRTAVLTRDSYKCVICRRGKPQVRVLQADHIKSWARHPEERYNVANGRTLCLRCHKRTLNYGRKGGSYQNDPQTDAEWVKKEKASWKKSTLKKKLMKSVKKGKLKSCTKK